MLKTKMDPYSEFIYVKLDKASDKDKVNEGAYMIFHEHTLTNSGEMRYTYTRKQQGSQKGKGQE
jgi:hypothetical protein